MKLSQKLAVVFIVFGLSAMVLSSGAFTLTQGERTSDVDVASDDSALVELEIAEPVDAEANSKLVSVTNNFEDTSTVRVELMPATAAGVTLVNPRETIPAGGTESFTVDVDRSQQPQVIEFRLSARTSAGNSVTLLRRATIEAIRGPCAGDTLIIDSKQNSDVDTEKNVELAAGVVVNGNVDAGGCVIMNDKSQVKGDVDAGSNIDAGERTSIGGDANGGGDLTLGEASKVKGNVDVDGSVDMAAKTQVKGNVDAGGAVTIEEKGQVKGDVTTSGAVTMSSDVKVSGDVDSGAAVTLKAGAQIKGNLAAGGKVTLGDKALVKGDLDASGDVDLGAKTSVDGDITGSGAFSLGEDGDVNGDVAVAESATLGVKANVGGDLDTGGNLMLGEKSLIQGNVALTTDVTLDMGVDSEIRGGVEANDPASITVVCAEGARIDGQPCDEYTIE